MDKNFRMGQSLADRRLEIWEEMKTKDPRRTAAMSWEQLKKKIQEQEKEDMRGLNEN